MVFGCGARKIENILIWLPKTISGNWWKKNNSDNIQDNKKKMKEKKQTTKNNVFMRGLMFARPRIKAFIHESENLHILLSTRHRFLFSADSFRLFSALITIFYSYKYGCGIKTSTSRIGFLGLKFNLYWKRSEFFHFSCCSFFFLHVFDR